MHVKNWLLMRGCALQVSSGHDFSILSQAATEKSGARQTILHITLYFTARGTFQLLVSGVGTLIKLAHQSLDFFC